MIKVDDRHYETFNPSERIQLAIAALARNDVQEVRHLWNTCRDYTYTARDLEYKERFQAFTIVCVLFAEFCTEHHSKIFLSELMSMTLSFATDTSNPSLQSLIQKVNELEKIKPIHISHLKAVYKGLEKFCDDVGLNYHDVIKTVHLKERCLNIEEYLATEIEADKALTQIYKERFLECWRF